MKGMKEDDVEVAPSAIGAIAVTAR